MKRFLVFLSAAALVQSLSAARLRSGVPSTDFDGKLSGARFIAMGAQGAALAGGPESPIWNPAALHDLSQPTFSADFDVSRQSRLADAVLIGNNPLRGRKLTYLGFAAQDTAFFYRPLANFNERTITDPANPAYNFIDENLEINQFGFSAASEGEKDAIMGINLTYLNAHRSLAVAATGQPPVVDFADGNGFTLDLGLRRKWEYGALGASFLNVPGVLYWNRYKGDQLPVIARAGAVFYPVPAFGLSTEYEKRFYRGGLPKPHALHLGMELTALSWFQLRGGTYGEELSDVDKTSYTGGFSALSPKGYQVDFAFRSYRFQAQRVINYFLSILLPLPNNVSQENSSSSGRFQGK